MVSSLDGVRRGPSSAIEANRPGRPCQAGLWPTAPLTTGPRHQNWRSEPGVTSSWLPSTGAHTQTLHANRDQRQWSSLGDSPAVNELDRGHRGPERSLPTSERARPPLRTSTSSPSPPCRDPHAKIRRDPKQHRRSFGIPVRNCADARLRGCRFELHGAVGACRLRGAPRNSCGARPERGTAISTQWRP